MDLKQQKNRFVKLSGSNLQNFPSDDRVHLNLGQTFNIDHIKLNSQLGGNFYIL